MHALARFLNVRHFEKWRCFLSTSLVAVGKTKEDKKKRKLESMETMLRCGERINGGRKRTPWEEWRGWSCFTWSHSPLVLCVHPRPPFIPVAYFRRRNLPLASIFALSCSLTVRYSWESNAISDNNLIYRIIYLDKFFWSHCISRNFSR